MVQNIDDLVESVRLGYSFVGPTVDLGALVVDGEVHSDVSVRIPLGLLNRHGLIAGATGTGKTKTLQLLAEQLSAQGVAVFLTDVKGICPALQSRTAGRRNHSPCRGSRPAVAAGSRTG